MTPEGKTAVPGLRVTQFSVCVLPEDHPDHGHYEITVDYRGAGLWAVMQRGWLCLGSDGEWDFEASPSGREDDWLARHRFDQATALEMAVAEAPRVMCNGLVAADVAARLAGGVQ